MKKFFFYPKDKNEFFARVEEQLFPFIFIIDKKFHSPSFFPFL